MLDQDEKDYILLLASSSAPLDRSPKKNWVENAGGLPPYVRKLARGIMKSGGHDLSSAISIAISRIKVWAAGGGKVNADTKAKAAKALAIWNKRKASSHVKLSYPEEGVEYVLLSNVSSFNTEIVRAAWDSIQREKRAEYNAAKGIVPGSPEYYDTGYQHKWIVELGTDYIVVSSDNERGMTRYRLPYTVDEDNEVSFGEPKKIIQLWVEDDDELTDDEKLGLSNIPTRESALNNIVRLSNSLKQ